MLALQGTPNGLPRWERCGPDLSDPAHFFLFLGELLEVSGHQLAAELPVGRQLSWWFSRLAPVSLRRLEQRTGRRVCRSPLAL